ncbi:transposase, MuDR, MULE transposase domain protein [Tanacetum coccineum]
MSEDLTYSMLHEMMMKKFNLEANSQINLSFKLSSFDYTVDIIDDAEVQFFVGCACNSKDEFAHLFVSERQNNKKRQNDFQMNESSYKNEPHFTNPESSFAFRSNDEYADEKNDFDYGVDEKPQNKIHKWNKFMSFKPDIPDTPVYKSKPMISKQYSQQSKVKKGQNFDNKEALVLAVRLKALNDEQKNKGTVTRIKTDEKGVFEMLFIAIGASIRTFLNYLRPVLMIDAAHLKGLYKGTNMVVVAMDGNNQIVPIAFGICKWETYPCWSWWMSVLKECIGDKPNLLFISDRHAAIALAMNSL